MDRDLADNVHYVNQPIERFQALSPKFPNEGKLCNIVARRVIDENHFGTMGYAISGLLNMLTNVGAG